MPSGTVRRLPWAGAGLTALLAGAMLLAGCGSSASSTPTRSPTDTVSQMKSAVKAARSVHLNGTVHASGQAIGLNLGLIRSGGLSGTITENGVPLSLTETGGNVYIKATSAVLRQFAPSSSACSLVCGKYIKMTAAQAGALAGSLNMDRLLASLTGPLPKFSNGGTTTVRGQQAQVLRAQDGSTLDVAASGTAYPLRAVGKSSSGQLDFTQWNSVKQPAAPPANQVVNLSRLGR